jgi:hypothetical protein
VAQLIHDFVAGGIGDLHGGATLNFLEASGLALEGRLAEAGLLFSSATDTYRRLGIVIELSLATIVRATLIRPMDAATAAAVDEVRAILAGLRAAALLRLLDEAVAGSAEGVGPEARPSPAESTPSASASRRPA